MGSPRAPYFGSWSFMEPIRVFTTTDHPSLLFKQLEAHGYCVIDMAATGVVRDAADVVAGWFGLPQSMKLSAASSAAEIAAGCGRGFFVLPDKEVLEVGACWQAQGARADVRLAANAAYTDLRQTACHVLQLLFCTAAGNGLQASKEQLQSWVQQPSASQTAAGSSSCRSMLHISSYRPASPTPAAAAGAAANSPGTVLRGCEAHVDRGLLTVIAATSPGLQVLGRDASWVPVTSSQDQLVVLVGHTLSFATAGRLPAAQHRVVIEPGCSSIGVGGAAAAGPSDTCSMDTACTTASSRPPRMSLAFKLRAAPDAVFWPTQITGASLATLPARFQMPKTGQKLMAVFEATHLSINSPYQQQKHIKPDPEGLPQPPQQQQQQQPIISPSLQRQQQQQQQQQQRLQPIKPDADTKLQPDSSKRMGIKSDPYAAVLNIIVQDQEGREVHFKLRENTQLRKVFTAYCDKTGKEPLNVRFVFMGRLRSLYTPRDYDMQDGDVILAINEQLGD